MVIGTLTFEGSAVTFGTAKWAQFLSCRVNRKNL